MTDAEIRRRLTNLAGRSAAYEFAEETPGATRQEAVVGIYRAMIQAQGEQG